MKGKNEKGRVLGRVTALFLPITLSTWMTNWSVNYESERTYADSCPGASPDEQ